MKRRQKQTRLPRAQTHGTEAGCATISGRCVQNAMAVSTWISYQTDCRAMPQTISFQARPSASTRTAPLRAAGGYRQYAHRYRPGEHQTTLSSSLPLAGWRNVELYHGKLPGTASRQKHAWLAAMCLTARAFQADGFLWLTVSSSGGNGGAGL